MRNGTKLPQNCHVTAQNCHNKKLKLKQTSSPMGCEAPDSFWPVILLAQPAGLNNRWSEKIKKTAVESRSRQLVKDYEHVYSHEAAKKRKKRTRGITTNNKTQMLYLIAVEFTRSQVDKVTVRHCHCAVWFHTRPWLSMVHCSRAVLPEVHRYTHTHTATNITPPSLQLTGQ